MPHSRPEPHDDRDDEDFEPLTRPKQSRFARRSALVLIVLVMLALLAMFLILITRIQKAVERVGGPAAGNRGVAIPQEAVDCPGRHFAGSRAACRATIGGSTSSEATADWFNSASITPL